MLPRPSRPSPSPGRWRHDLAIVLLFLAMTALVTWPQVRGLASLVPYHSDPYFSIWRLGWVAHALLSDPRTFFEANIFYPAPSTLGYSDAMLLPGIVTAPFFWAGVNPVLIYNLALFAAFALSGWAACVLAKTLTGSNSGAVVAGIIFAFAPYRFCHYMHLELQMVFWIPLALYAFHRVVENGRTRDGLALGAVMAAQLLSSIYIGVFSVVYVSVMMPALLVVAGAERARRVLVPTLVGALLAMVVVSPYALAYRQAEREVGLRGLDDVRVYSASTKNYLSAPAMNRLYGWTAPSDFTWADEMTLFPGILACALALLGVFFGQGRARFAYLAGLAISIEMTRGASSPLYLWLFEHAPAFQALRSPARFDIFVNLSLGVLSAYGVGVLVAKIKHVGWRRVAGAALVAVLLAEYSSSPALEPAPGPTRVDALLATRPLSVIVELPLLSRRGFWGSLDAIYMAQGIGHFQKMLNGYSGHAPGSFYQMREAMGGFPDDRSMSFLKSLRVDYIVVRAGLYEADAGTALLDRLGKMDELRLEALWLNGPAGAEAIYRINN